MTAPRRFEQDLPALLTDLYLAGTPDYRDDLVQVTARTRQRPAWTFPERWLPVDIATNRISQPSALWRTVAVLAVLGALLAVAAVALTGSRDRPPAPFGVAANGQLVFTKDGDIYLQDSLDGAARLAVGGPEVDEAIAFSPTGTHLLVAREAGSGYDLLVAAADGSDPLRIGGPYLEPGRIEWSPDGSVVAVAHAVGGVETISLAQADGRGERTLEVGMPADEPTWRPLDGGQLAFRGRGDGSWGLFLVNADGSGLIRLAVPRDFLEDPFEALSPAWSPTGDRIAFHRLMATPGQGNGNGFRITIARVDAAGALSDVRTPTFDPTSDDEYSVTWTPDGKQLIFLRRDGDSDKVAIVSAEGSASTDLELTATGGFAGIRYTVAPDGNLVLAHLDGAGTDWVAELSSGIVRSHEIDSDFGASMQRRAP